MTSTLFSVAGRVALISGGGSGIGSYIAKGLAEVGASRVYITGRRAASLDNIVKSAPRVIIPIVGDVSSIEGCKKVVDQFVQLEKEAGMVDPSLDLLVNNAGISIAEGTWEEGKASPEGIRDALLQASDKDWSQAFAVNTAAIQWLSAAFLPYLAKAAKTNNGFLEGRGCIISNTSVSGLYVARDAQYHLYSASKAAAESVTQNLASKFTRFGVRVNSIAVANIPSEINDITNPKTFIAQNKDRVPVGRVGNEEDAVAAVLYLASRAGSYVSGTCIKVDGGILVAY